MNILVAGGTRFFGIPMIYRLIADGHAVTVATRGRTPDGFGDKIKRLCLDRNDEESVAAALDGRNFDVVIDKLAYSSNDVRRLLDHVKCGKYVLMSSAAVYEHTGICTSEDCFEPADYPLRWCERADCGYDEAKRQAECALVQAYSRHKYTIVRYPVVVGRNDYTGRLRFYVEKILAGEPMYIDDPDSRISLIDEAGAGEFMAYIAERDIGGAVNGCCCGDISPAEILGYIEERTGKKAMLTKKGEAAPYNGYPAFAVLDTSKAMTAGFVFCDVKEAVYRTIDSYLAEL
ncbi:NAD-dependent epimerase/dehydratase family protein [Ruminococcus sp.]|uniref:NAD-dependent epimerase/dehydratase family protein n=1 Tax=Ruminococcus sp. TaxID=41978 RepID=UPI001B49E7E1|nr:NAD-dependent epimerase/dehydratase family protein [Ruminococcus sp.]MBP5432480.1 NAD-dependent epimerase/dehydratase family protein [Ruminococcus sp.]